MAVAATPPLRGALLDELVRLSDELRPLLANLLGPAVSAGIVQGVQLELDRYWYHSALSELARLKGQTGAPEQPGDLAAWIRWESTFGQPALNWNYRPADWAIHCKAMGYVTDPPGAAEPILIRVLLRDPGEAKRMEGAPQPAGLPPSAFPLPQVFRNRALIYEMRPPIIGASFFFDAARGALGLRQRATLPDRSIGRAEPNTAGTAGGYLRDPNSDRRFAVSCAHVLGPVGTEVFRPGPYEGRLSAPAGIVRFSSVSPLKPSDQPCGIEVFFGAARLDIAVAELHVDDIAPSGPDRVRLMSQIPPFHAVTFAGKVSGVVAAQINAITVWQDVYTHAFGDGPAGFRCYGRIFELAGRRGDAGPIAREGDSGAWVMDEVGGIRSWVGVVIGTQGARAYGCFAEPVMEAIRNDPSFPSGLAL